MVLFYFFHDREKGIDAGKSVRKGKEGRNHSRECEMVTVYILFPSLFFSL